MLHTLLLSVLLLAPPRARAAAPPSAGAPAPCGAGTCPAASHSTWARCEGGRITYKRTAEGHAIMDFSSAGYRGGGAALPNLDDPSLLRRIAVERVTCAGAAGDGGAVAAALERAAAATAVDAASGLRAVVVLSGRECRLGADESINITASGIALKGAGGGVLITRAGGPRELPTIAVAPPPGGGGGPAFKGPWLRLAGEFVPSGSRELLVESPGCAGLKAGASVAVRRVASREWAAGLTWESGFKPPPGDPNDTKDVCDARGWVGLDVLCTAEEVDNWGYAKSPKSCGTMDATWHRTVLTAAPEAAAGGGPGCSGAAGGSAACKAAAGAGSGGAGLCRVTLDAPVSDALNGPGLGHAWLRVFTGRSRLLHDVGVEGLSGVIAPDDECRITYDTFLLIASCEDCWARRLGVTGYNSAVSLQNARRVTVAGVTSDRGARWPKTPASAPDAPPSVCSPRPIDFLIGSKCEQVLIANCTSKSEGVFSLATGSVVAGPVVAANFSGAASSPLQPHMRWATGLLVEDSSAPLEFKNRRCAGTRHGWAAAFSVAWNVEPPAGVPAILDAPRGVPNWVIGGAPAGARRSKPNECCDGIVELTGKQAAPRSLYNAQLQVRQRGSTGLCG